MGLAGVVLPVCLSLERRHRHEGRCSEGVGGGWFTGGPQAGWIEAYECVVSAKACKQRIRGLESKEGGGHTPCCVNGRNQVNIVVVAVDNVSVRRSQRL
jgi:hypothetical protein